MRTTSANETRLVRAARDGDRRALDELVTAYLPFVYTIVRRALADHPDVDDIVQDTMLRAVRDLRTLRTPESFRAWLAAIAVRQLGTHVRRGRVGARRRADLDEAADIADTEADVAGLTVLRLEISDQRRQVVRAGRWLDPDDRTLLSLWWLETAGVLARRELAAALGLSAAHAAVRVQRMRGQLEASRALVSALDASPRCPGLDAVVAGWDGRPSPLWRKRIGRHTRGCPACERAGAQLVATERLLVGFALLSVPLTVTTAVAGHAPLTGAGAAPAVALSGAKAGLFSTFGQLISGHPVAATVVAGVLAAGAVVTAAWWPSPASPPAAIAGPAPPAAVSGPSTGPATLAPGPGSLESANQAGQFVAAIGDVGVLLPVGAGSDDPARRRATFEVEPGLADPRCFSFRGPDGRYLRHSSWQLRLHQDDGSRLFRRDATFCVRAGSTPGSVSLESANYPGRFLRHRGEELWVDRADGTAAFRADSSFRPWSPLAR